MVVQEVEWESHVPWMGWMREGWLQYVGLYLEAVVVVVEAAERARVAVCCQVWWMQPLR